MDKFNEKLVEGKPGALDLLMAFGSFLVIFVGVVCSIKFSWGVFIIALGIFGAFAFRGSQKIEWEYSLVNGDTEISKIIDKKNRKTVRSIALSDITAFDKATSDKAKNDLSLKQQVTIDDYTGKNSKPEDCYVLYSNLNGKNHITILELDEKCVEHYKFYLKQKTLFR